jgi:hypothetical protein
MICPRFSVGQRVDARNGRGWTYDCIVVSEPVVRGKKIVYTVRAPNDTIRNFTEDSLKPPHPSRA